MSTDKPDTPTVPAEPGEYLLNGERVTLRWGDEPDAPGYMLCGVLMVDGPDTMTRPAARWADGTATDWARAQTWSGPLLTDAPDPEPEPSTGGGS